MDLYENLKDNPYFEFFDVKKQHDRQYLSKEELYKEFEKENKEKSAFMNRYENPFMNIPSFENKLIFMFSEGDSIVVQEKIDGSNTHLNVSKQGFQCCSNNCILNSVNHLQGFWHWCSDHYNQVPEQYFGLDIYGEWLVPHHCEYPASRYGNFYVFDVMENGKYWPQNQVEQLAKECHFSYAPVLYQGSFSSWKHLMSFVGRTGLSGEKGEGIVVKNQTTLNSKKSQFYIKIVDVEFQETNKSRKVVKTVNMDKILEMEETLMLCESIVTLPRVRKIILKLVDSSELPAEWNILDNQALIKIVKPHVIRDCIKEEKEITDKIGNGFGRYCNDLLGKIIPELKDGV